MLGIIEAIFLGIVQGLTEWFPISSSGHLALFQNVLGLEVPVLFDIYLHLGTLSVLFFFFWKDISDIIKDLFKLKFKSPNVKLLGYIIAGTFVTALVGFLFHDYFSSLFKNLLYVGYAFLATGLILLLSNKKRFVKRKLNLIDSLAIGLFQGLALIPGISRSGATIGFGMMRGIDRLRVAKFSFLLSIPSIIGATIMESFNLSDNPFDFFLQNALPVIFGVLAAAITGYICLSYLMKVLKEGKFHYFAYYVFGVGIITILLAIF